MKKLILTAATLVALAAPALATGPEGCALVAQTPDGYLSLRVEPTVKSAAIAKLRSGELLYADATECQLNDDCYIARWTHVVTRNNQEGWVATKYLEFTPSRECIRG